jgi:hypothetical protein
MNTQSEKGPRLPSRSPYSTKDQEKSDRANKFIGRGSRQSSTNAYAAAWGNRANCGVYQAGDVVFVSAEGARNGRIPINEEELKLAAKAKVTFITDKPADRHRSYNVGEREVEAFLRRENYQESQPGCWVPIDPAVCPKTLNPT